MASTIDMPDETSKGNGADRFQLIEYELLAKEIRGIDKRVGEFKSLDDLIIQAKQDVVDDVKEEQAVRDELGKNQMQRVRRVQRVIAESAWKATPIFTP